MANSYTQVYIQYVFAVKYRRNLLPCERHEDLCKFVSGMIRQRKCKALAINHVSDHIHLFVSQHPSISMAKLMQDLKSVSSAFIKEHLNLPTFSWQGGYGAFSYSKSHIENVVHYIERQQKHHSKESFKEEYVDLLKKFEIEYKDDYLFDFYLRDGGD